VYTFSTSSLPPSFPSSFPPSPPPSLPPSLQVHNKIKRQQQQQQQHHHEQRRSCPSPPPALLSLALACLSLLVETEGGREGGKEVALELYVSLREGLGGAFLETPPSPLVKREGGRGGKTICLPHISFLG